MATSWGGRPRPLGVPRLRFCWLPLLLTACTHPPHQRLIVLGVDGMDPHFVERHWSQLPNLRRLRDQGSFSTLATTTPPQSPVAWTTFSTGLDPAQHGVFDFVHRDPATLQPMSSFAETLPPAHQLSIGPYLLPLSKAQVRSFRTGRTFWEILAGRGIPAMVIRMPANYPPVQHGGEQLAGMGTPDLEGTFGTFTYYTDDPLEIAHDVPGGRIVPVTADHGRADPAGRRTARHSPPRSRAHASRSHRRHRRRCGCRALPHRGPRVHPETRRMVPWIRVSFPLIDHLASVHGMFRLYARQLQGGIRIYRSPLNIDPFEPALPISAPSGDSRDIARRIGPFYTQGIEEDTAALRQGASRYPSISPRAASSNASTRRLLRDSLARYHDGLLFFYFSEIDQNSHMLWGKHEAELLETYRAVDDSIGTVMASAGNATIMVMSDHGFAAFDYAFNLNTWLVSSQWLPRRMTAAIMIDWRATREAYAMGLNALYINLAGREKYGIVHDGRRT